MGKLRIVVPLAGIVALLAAMPASRLQACAPFIQSSAFWWGQLPDADLVPFSKGNLGIVSPRFARSYLIVAYRVLSGATMSDDEALAMQRDWEFVLNHGWVPGEPWATRWEQARKRVARAAPADVKTYSSDGQFAYTLNIHADAFKTATETLRDRERRFGPRSAVLANWVRAQDVVFAEGTVKDVEAVPVPAGAPEIARADRTYQAAAAAFYNGEYADARRRFLAIAGDTASPWRGLGTYLAARSALREEEFSEAQRLLEAVVADPSQGKLHASARGLLLRVRQRVEPDEQLRPWLANAVLAPRPGPSFGVLVRHLALAIDRYSPAETADARDAVAADLFPGEEPATGRDGDTNPSLRFSTMSSLRGEHDLLDWIVTFQSTDNDAQSHALSRWRQTRRPVWLVGAIAGLRSLTARGAADVMAAAAALPLDSPAYATVTFHRARLFFDAGRRDEARTVLDAALASPALPVSSVNRFHDLRLRTARSLDELIPDLAVQAAGVRAEDYPSYRFSPFAKGCGFGEMMDTCEELRTVAKRPQLLSRAASLVDGLPIDLVAQLGVDERLPESVRREILQAGWVRAFVLGDDGRLRTLAIELAKQYKATDAALSSELMRLESLALPADRRFEAAWIIARHPVMSPFVRPGLSRLLAPSTIDDFGDNWWDEPRLTRSPEGEYEAGVLLSPAPFLNAEARRVVQGEHRRLRAAGPGGPVIARAVVESATTRLTDPRVPEALYRAVRATRLAGGGEWSRRAYVLLHKEFANNPWTRRTPFWY